MKTTDHPSLYYDDRGDLVFKCPGCNEVYQHDAACGCDFCPPMVYYCPGCVRVYDARGLACDKHHATAPRLPDAIS